MSNLLRIRRWGMVWGHWWCVQWSLDWCVSLGIHLDFRRRINQESGVSYGPYLDLHFGPFILSLGNRPVYSGCLDSLRSYGRSCIPVKE